MFVYNKQLLINMYGMNIKKHLSLLWREIYCGAKYIFTVEDVCGNLLCLDVSNIFQFNSGDTDKFTDCLQGITLVIIFKCFFFLNEGRLEIVSFNVHGTTTLNSQYNNA